MKRLGFKPETVKTCLIDGVEHGYDLCSQEKNGYSKYKHLRLEYLGQGRIWCVNGINQNSERTLHFWKLA